VNREQARHAASSYRWDAVRQGERLMVSRHQSDGNGGAYIVRTDRRERVFRWTTKSHESSRPE
jgi:hypothetical protein